MKTKVGEGLRFHCDNWIRRQRRFKARLVSGRRMAFSSSIAASAFPMLTKMLSGLTSVTSKFRSVGQGP